MRKNLVVQIFIAFVVGLSVGIGLWLSGVDVTGYTGIVSPFGSVLVAMLKMVVVPVIFFSLIAGAASLPTGDFGKIGVKVIVWYFLTSLVAAVIGSILALIVNPGSGASLQAWQGVVSTTQASAIAKTTTVAGALATLLLSMFQNPFEALSSGNFLAIIIFAIAFGLALKLTYDNCDENDAIRGKIKNLLDLIEAVQRGIFKIVDWVLAYSPIGVFALTSCNFATYGTLLFGPYVSLTLGVIMGVLFMVLVAYPILLFIVTKHNPLEFYKKVKEASLTAFVTRSSAATLPVSMNVANDLGVDKGLSSFALPLGATINMDGVCVHLPFFAVLAANLFGVQLGFTGLAALVITTVLASVGAGGVPGGSLMLLFIILKNMGLEPGQIAIVVGLAVSINPILDMFETMNNVTGDLVCTYAVADNSGMIEKDE